MRALIVFGALSDKDCFMPLIDILRGKKAQVDVDFHVISAHRDPQKLQDILQAESRHVDFIVAAAGLAAHLPGVVASQVTLPVFGLAVPSAFGGLDAFASIVQMPYGLPVITWKMHDWANVAPLQRMADFVGYWRSLRGRPNLRWVVDPLVMDMPEFQQEWKKVQVLKDSFTSLPSHIMQLGSESAEKEVFHIHVLSLQHMQTLARDPFSATRVPQGLWVPFLNHAQRSAPENFLQFDKCANNANCGPWLGSNMLRNAFLAFVQLFWLRQEVCEQRLWSVRQR